MVSKIWSDEYYIMHFNELYRCTNSGYSKLAEKSGIVKKKLIKFNVGLTGTVGSLNVSNMSMKPKEIHAILTEQLRKYKE